MISWEWEEGRGRRPCNAPHGYDNAVKKLTAIYGITDILLAADQEDAIAWAKEQKKHDVHWLDNDRSKLDHGSGWIENRADIIGKAETEGALEALDFLAHGQVFIGNMGSFFSRAVYKQMIGMHNVVVPWISVGRSLDSSRREPLRKRCTLRKLIALSHDIFTERAVDISN
mmetsp:Transcript_14635/g.59720  ORF Transcript_14635/g.59720 Transcript_14635/m.59720 type:complete len:171 (-) Transcript_14635:444-956(-)